MVLHRCDICRKEVAFGEITSVRSEHLSPSRFSADLCFGCAEQCLQTLRKRLEESARVREALQTH